MTHKSDEYDSLSLEELLEEAMDVLEWELDQKERVACSARANDVSECDIQNAVEDARCYGHLQAVCELVDSLKADWDPPRDSVPNSPSQVLSGNFRRAIAFLKKARPKCPTDRLARLDSAILLLLPYTAEREVS
jgi:hypothetical protein